MLLVTIPLCLSLCHKIVTKSQKAKQDTKSETSLNVEILRYKLLKLVCIWTLTPLIFTPREGLIKHLLFFLDIYLTDLFLNTSLHTDDAWYSIKLQNLCSLQYVYEKAYFWAKVGIFVIQAVSTVTINSEWTFFLYTQMLPTIASGVNQLIFVEILYEVIFKDSD